MKARSLFILAVAATTPLVGGCSGGATVAVPSPSASRPSLPTATVDSGGGVHEATPDATASAPSAPTASASMATALPSAATGVRTINMLDKSGKYVGVVYDMPMFKPGQCKVRVADGPAGLVFPDAACTPGARDQAITQENLGSTVCVANYTTNVMRPATSQTNKAKALSLKAYGMKYDKTIEYDHFLPLSLGGASSISNLWPEPNDADATSTHNPKDAVEMSLLAAVCSKETVNGAVVYGKMTPKGRVTLAAAQDAILTDWTTAKQKLGLPETKKK